MRKKVLISINTAWNIYNFRSGLIRALINHGYEVVAVAPHDEYAPRLAELGCRFIPMPMESNGTNPRRDLMLLVRYFRMLRAERPLVFLGYTVKPNVYGSLAAHVLRIPVVNNIAGLGTTFINNGFLTRIVKLLYRTSLRRSRRVFFQNAEDQELFTRSGLVRPESTDRLPGSGMDLGRFQPASSVPGERGPFVFLLVARMLKDKGVEEFVEAARLVRSRFDTVRFELLGFVDAANPNSVPMERIRSWENEKVVHYLGRTDDVRPYLSGAECVVLPSYREGVPRSLLEAAAMARPIIATDVAGCRDVVDDNVNGLLCRPRDPLHLAEKMMEMMTLSSEKRQQMGMAGRRRIETEFDERLVIQKYLEVIRSINGESSSNEPIGDSALVLRGKVRKQ